jgi:hypothetical protein
MKIDLRIIFPKRIWRTTMEIIEKIARFDIYCKTCKHKDLDEHLDPCNDCLAEGTNDNTRKPKYWEEAKK